MNEKVLPTDLTFPEAFAVVWHYKRVYYPRLKWTKAALHLNPRSRVAAYGSRVRVVPWPHLAEFHALLEVLLTADNAAAKPALLLAKSQVQRRLLATQAPHALGRTDFVALPGDKNWLGSDDPADNAKYGMADLRHLPQPDVAHRPVAIAFLRHWLTLDAAAEPPHWSPLAPSVVSCLAASVAP